MDNNVDDHEALGNLKDGEKGNYLPTVTDSQFASFFKFISDPALHSSSEHRDLSYFVSSRLVEPLILKINSELTRHPQMLQSLPHSLRLVRNFRKIDLRRSSISESVLQDPPHPWIQEIYDGWLADHQKIERLCIGGDIFEPTAVADYLVGPNAKESAQEIASTIWALGFARELSWQNILGGLLTVFQGAIGSVPDGISLTVGEPKQIKRQRERNNQIIRDRKAATKARNEAQRRVKALEEQLSRTRAETKQAKQGAARALIEARSAESSKSRMSDRMDKMATELGASKRNLTSQNKQLEKTAKQSSRFTLEYETERDAHIGTRGQLKELEEALQTSRTEIDLLPQGLDAAWTVIQAELEEVRLHRNTSEGGTKRQLDNKYRSLKLIADEFVKSYPQYARPKSGHVNATKKAEIRFESLGGGNEIGASCYLLKIGSSEILIDAGIRVNRRIDEMGPDLSRWDHDAPSIQGVIVTHAHSDHSGWLPALVAQWRDLDIFCTPETKELLEVMLFDSFMNIRRELARCYVLSEYTGERIPDLPYTEVDIETALRNILTLPFHKIHSFGPDLQFRFLPAGHILGASSVLFEGSGRRVLISGDYATFDQQTVKSYNWNEAKSSGIDLLVSESTYGHCREKTRSDLESSLVREVKDVTSRRGTALIPCFALGRAQEVITILDRAFKSGELEPFRVWVDGMIDRINPVYEKYDNYSVGEHIVERRTSGYTIQEVIGWCKGNPAAIVTTSGMMSGGPVLEYAKCLLEDGRNRVLLCGYQDEESPGMQLLKLFETDAAKRILRLPNDDGGITEIKVRAKARNFELSAHSDLGEMVEAIVGLIPEHVVLVHGERDQRHNLANALQKEGLNVAAGRQRLERGLSPLHLSWSIRSSHRSPGSSRYRPTTPGSCCHMPYGVGSWTSME